MQARSILTIVAEQLSAKCSSPHVLPRVYSSPQIRNLLFSSSFSTSSSSSSAQPFFSFVVLSSSSSRLHHGRRLQIHHPITPIPYPTRSISSNILHTQIVKLEARHKELTSILLCRSGNNSSDETGDEKSRSNSETTPPTSPLINSSSSTSIKDMAKLSRELVHLDKAVLAIQAYNAALAEAADLEALISSETNSSSSSSNSKNKKISKDGEGLLGGENLNKPKTTSSTELVEMAQEELEAVRNTIDEKMNAIVQLLLPPDDADTRDAILEIRMGVGGEEAALFAADLFHMYEQYAAARGWVWKPLQSQVEEGYGGIREAAVSVTGEGVFGALKHESGVHRVQRIPITQSTGKLQTSTATVAVLPEAEEVDIEVKASDLRIDTYRASGAGGQHVNTTDSAVRITHLPTGLVVAIQDERSQTQNKTKALHILRARLFELERQRTASERSSARRAQIGNSARSERVRTYNFMQNRITDHRLGGSKHNTEAFMRGEDLAEFGQLLDKKAQEELLELMNQEAADEEAEKEKALKMKDKKKK